jgi:hypothetical protein
MLKLLFNNQNIMKFIKKELFLSVRPDHELYGKKVKGYLWTNENGVNLFLHKSLAYSKVWNASEPSTGLGVSAVNGSPTREAEIEKALIRIANCVNRVGKTWQELIAANPVLNPEFTI